MVELNISLCERICVPNHEKARTISGPHLEVPQYFTIHVSDACFDGDGIDFETIMGNESINEPTQLKSHINDLGLVMTDSEFNFPEWKSTSSYNLILIGGPVANEIVRHLVDECISLVTWEDSPGQREYIKAPYNRCDVLIVAGADRECTSAAVQELVDCL
jgi:S-layer protein (TIGR01564 family)